MPRGRELKAAKGAPGSTGRRDSGRVDGHPARARSGSSASVPAAERRDADLCDFAFLRSLRSPCGLKDCWKRACGDRGGEPDPLLTRRQLDLNQAFRPGWLVRAITIPSRRSRSGWSPTARAGATDWARSTIPSLLSFASGPSQAHHGVFAKL
jgi:hypothetical protein